MKLVHTTGASVALEGVEGDLLLEVLPRLEKLGFSVADSVSPEEVEKESKPETKEKPKRRGHKKEVTE